MRSAPLLLAILLAGQALSWVCPRCGSGEESRICTVCGLPERPEGMVFVPGTSVTVDGREIEVAPFYMDSMPVTYREVLPWMEEVVTTPEELAAVVTGQLDDSFQFLAFTPFINNEEGTALTVPASCLGLPAASFTWQAASLYLHDNGEQLPTVAQLLAAHGAGLLEGYDVYASMSAYSDILLASMGSLLGSLGSQSMFAGYSTASERVMWEWTRDAWGFEADPQIDDAEIYRTLFRPLETPELGAAGRDTGYFNVIFRGVVVLPYEWQ